MLKPNEVYRYTHIHNHECQANGIVVPRDGVISKANIKELDMLIGSSIIRKTEIIPPAPAPQQTFPVQADVKLSVVAPDPTLTGTAVINPNTVIMATNSISEAELREKYNSMSTLREFARPFNVGGRSYDAIIEALKSKGIVI